MVPAVLARLAGGEETVELSGTRVSEVIVEYDVGKGKQLSWILYSKLEVDKRDAVGWVTLLRLKEHKEYRFSPSRST
jgi:hypothetical protein